MSFICAICRDLLKITEEASPRHQHQYLSANTGLANHQHPNHVSPSAISSSSSNNVSGGRRKEKNNSIVATKCGHLFHYPCLSVWLSQSVNLTTDSKMRCPSCKQLIYIYELVQLFPVENNGCSSGNGLEHVFSAPFQQKMQVMMEQLENLVRDLGKNSNNNGSPITPTRFQRIMDSPKKLNASQQWAEIINDFNLLRGSISELNSIMDQHAELGSVVERQNKELSELRSRNAELLLENEELKLKNEVVTVTTTANASATMPMIDIDQDNENVAATLPKSSSSSQSQTDSDSGIMDEDAKDAQVSDDSLEIPLVPPPQAIKDSAQGEGPNNSPLKDKERRPSVRFLEPFDEFNEIAVNNGSIPIDKKDLRLGDKVVWYFEGNPEVGTVKWKGFIGSQINVGVEFERQLGLPIKDLDAIQYIFKSKPGHGRLIPVNELIFYDKGLFSDKLHPHLNSSTPTAAYNDCVHSVYSKHSGGSGPSGLKRIQVCAHQ